MVSHMLELREKLHDGMITTILLKETLPASAVMVCDSVLFDVNDVDEVKVWSSDVSIVPRPGIKKSTL